VTVISATHDHKMLKRSDRILWISDGRIVKDGKPADLDLPLAAQPARPVRQGSVKASPPTPPPRKESPGTPEVIIAAQGVKRRYVMGGEEVWALKGLDLEIFRGEFLSIMGPSGSGKSTFFNQLGALDVPTEGKVLFEGQNLFDLPERQQAWVRNRKLGYIFQNYNLIGVMTALENVMLPATFVGDSKAEARRKATEVLDRVGLSHRLNHKPGELSGGQQQRVAVARALVNTPDVILADEPTANLDSKTGGELIELLGQLNRERGVTIICATHDHKMLQASQRICAIRDGRLEKISTGAQFRLDELPQDKLGLRQ
jgi:putative ABC transport system ATP-binding protein